eukprot:scaffold147527_cov34-Tisochrysis_lutea.AAC.1
MFWADGCDGSVRGMLKRMEEHTLTSAGWDEGWRHPSGRCGGERHGARDHGHTGGSCRGRPGGTHGERRGAGDGTKGGKLTTRKGKRGEENGEDTKGNGVGVGDTHKRTKGEKRGGRILDGIMKRGSYEGAPL